MGQRDIWGRIVGTKWNGGSLTNLRVGVVANGLPLNAD